VQAGQQLELELDNFNDAAAQAGLQTALALKLEREQALGATRSEYDDLSAKLRAPTSSAGLRAQPGAAARADHQAAAGSRRRSWVARSTWSSWRPPSVDLEALAVDRRRRRQAVGPADRDRPHQPRRSMPRWAPSTWRRWTS
jgi:hypothetical protein